MNPQFTRKKLLVNRRVQRRVIFHVLFLWFGYHVVLWHMMLFFRFVQYCGERLTGGAARPGGDLFAEFVHNHYSMLICGVIALPFLVWDVLKLTHRFVGPLVQFQSCLALLTRGEQVTEVRIRKGDFLSDLRDSFNEFLCSPHNPGRERELPTAQISEPSQAVAICDDADAVKADVENIQTAIGDQLDAADHALPSR